MPPNPRKSTSGPVSAPPTSSADLGAAAPPSSATGGSTSARFVLAAGPVPASAPALVATTAEAELGARKAPAGTQETVMREDEDEGEGERAGSPARGKEGEKREGGGNGAVTIEDLQLPKTILTRLAKGMLPPSTQIQANAVTALGKSATVFVNYLASHADANAKAAGKKTILPQDVFKALDEIEFGFMRPALEEEFAKYSSKNSSKRSTYRQRIATVRKPAPGSSSAAAAGEAAAAAAPVAADDSAMAVDDDDGAPRVKRARTAADAGVVDDDDDDDTEVDDTALAEDEPEEEEDDDEEEEDEDEKDEDERARGGVLEEEEEERDLLEEKEGEDELDEALDGNDSD